MAKNQREASPSSSTNNTTSSNSTSSSSSNSSCLKVKRARKSGPRGSPSQRSSVYRGVTRHRWTGRFEAHLWDKSCWNESQSKKGKQVYLGAYDDEDAAAHAYDLAALKYWGQDTILNFPLQTYQEELREMEGQSKEEYIGTLRRKSSGFSRGVSKYRGVARHHHNGRWEARIGRVFGNKYLYLGTYATQEEAAMAYDMAAIEYRGLNAVTNFDLSRYINWLSPSSAGPDTNPVSNSILTEISHNIPPPNLSNLEGSLQYNHQHIVGDISQLPCARPEGATASSALELLLQSAELEEMIARTPAASSSSSPPKFEPTLQPCSFPDDIQTYFKCEDGASYGNIDDAIFGELDIYLSPLLECELDI